MRFGMITLTAQGKSITFQSGTDPIITLNNTQPFNPPGTGINIERRDSFTYLRYSDGVRIKWDDSMTVYLTIDQSYKGKSTGLCGFYNNDYEGLYLLIIML